MSGSDERKPFPNDDLPAEGPSRSDLQGHVRTGDVASNSDAEGADPHAASESEGLFPESPAFVLPSIPIEPTRPIHAPASRALAFGDDLIDLARDPLGLSPSNFAPRVQIPDELPPDHFEMARSFDPNRPAWQRNSGFAPGDSLTETLRPEADSVETEPSQEAPTSAFPITPLAPFTATIEPDFIPEALHVLVPEPEAARAQTHQSASELESALAATHAGHAQAGPVSLQPASPGASSSFTPGSPSFPLTSGDTARDQQPQIDPIPDSRYPVPDFQPEPESRIPNFTHLLLLGVIALFGLLAAGTAVQVAFRFHLWGVTTIEAAATDVHYTLASMAVLYIFSFAVAFFLFPLLWQKPFFAGLQWNASAAVRHAWLLFAAASFCFILAIVDELILPGPDNAPIDKMFSNTTAAWLLFAFGVTVAPFFEEITFRGFILPAFCTTYDWIAEYVESETQWSRPALVLGSAAATSALAGFCEQKFGHHRLAEWLLVSCFIAVVCGLAVAWWYHRYQTLGAGSRVRPLGPNGHPQWSLAAMIVGSVLTSIPFAAMHADQTGYSLGPFVLLFFVSIILCFARLATRSLAASTLVHATYNFILFSLMLVGTGGFKHLDKM